LLVRTILRPRASAEKGFGHRGISGQLARRSGHHHASGLQHKKFWDGLPDEVRTQLKKAMDEATDYANGIAQQENDDAIAAMKKAGTMTFYELTADEKAEWIKAMQPVADEMASRIGKDLIAEFRKEAGGGS
jgi:TRAP-type mannitol/chloroaromatic compound transport system substrate-binding protein